MNIHCAKIQGRDKEDVIQAEHQMQSSPQVPAQAPGWWMSIHVTYKNVGHKNTEKGQCQASDPVPGHCDPKSVAARS